MCYGIVSWGESTEANHMFALQKRTVRAIKKKKKYYIAISGLPSTTYIYINFNSSFTFGISYITKK